jgi:hypothetical protein
LVIEPAAADHPLMWNGAAGSARWTRWNSAKLQTCSTCGRASFKNLVEAGEIPAQTNGAVVRISRADIEVFRRRAGSGSVGVREAEICALFLQTEGCSFRQPPPRPGAAASTSGASEMGVPEHRFVDSIAVDRARGD